MLAFTGGLEETASQDRTQGYVVPGSVQLVNGSYVPNSTPAYGDDYNGATTYWSGSIYRNVGENLVVDATAFKIREIAVSYDVPKSVLNSTFINSLSLSLYARNPIIIYSKDNRNFADPETASSNDNAAGIALTTQYPTTRTFGLKLTQLLIKKMKNKLYIIALSSLLLGATSCNDYLDINESPDRISVNDLTPNFVFPGAVTNSYYVQARRLNLFAGLMMNSVAGNSYSYGTPFVDEYSPNITSAFYADVWDQLFRNVANFQFVLDYSDPTGEYTQYKAMSKIMKAYYVQTLTDLWGDMPYSEAFKEN
ncbi:hypothetical protein OWR28_05625 [Chryseobacterium sp. 1B4]